MAEFHNIEPIYNADSRILILGSFPSVKSREGQFFYHHPQNRFWSVLSAVLEHPRPETIEEKREMLLARGVALWDVIASCEITGSSDSSIKNAVPNDIASILRAADIRAVFCNGAAAHKLFRKHLQPQTGIEAIPLPSTSPANAAWSQERLTAAWRSAITPYLNR